MYDSYKLKTKVQHYVPQFYLKKFLDMAFGSKGMLHVYDRKTSSYYLSSPKDICANNYTYEVEWRGSDPHCYAAKDKMPCVLPNRIENRFGELECIWANMLSNVLNRIRIVKNVLIEDERQQFALFLSNLYYRNPWTMNEQSIMKIENGLIESKEVHKIRYCLQSIGFLRNNNISPLIRATQLRSFVFDASETMAKDMVDNGYIQFLLSPIPIFITSSFPLLIYNSAFYLPLSPTVMLKWAVGHNDVHDNQCVSISVENAMYLNCLYLKEHENKTRWLISSDEAILRQIVS